MEASSALKTSGSQDQSQHATTGAVARLQSTKAWMWDVYASTTRKLLPAVEGAYRENKAWCDRLGGVAVVVGYCSGMVSLSTLCYLGGGFAMGALYCRGSMRESVGGNVPSLNSPSSPRLLGDDVCSKEDIVSLMKVIDDLLMKFLDLNSKADALTADRTAAAVKRWRDDVSKKKGAISDDTYLKGALQIAGMIKPHLFLVLLHESSGVHSAGEDFGEIVRELLGGIDNSNPEIVRKSRAGYRQLADYFLRSDKGQEAQIDILHKLTASWTIANETKAVEVLHKIDKLSDVAYKKWKSAHPGMSKGGFS